MALSPQPDSSESRPPSPPEAACGSMRAPSRSRVVLRSLRYSVMGALAAQGAHQLGLLPGLEHELLLGGLAGLILGATRLRGVVWGVAALVVAALLLIGYTPLSRSLAQSLARDDTLGSAPAVVVLNSFVFRDQTLSASAQERLARGYEVLGQGYAPRLVLTRGLPPAGSWEEPVRVQMSRMRLAYPVELVGPVDNTHDEAVAVAKLARERGWDHVILVTHPWHMRRAAAAFEKAGVKVTCAPCSEGRYDFKTLDSPRARIGIFGYWVREWVGYHVYSWRGWV